MARTRIPSFDACYLSTLAALVLAGIAYSIATRTPEEYILFVGIHSVTWFFLLLKWSLDLAYQRHGRIPDHASFGAFVYLLMRAVPLGVASYGAWAGLRSLYEWVVIAEYGTAVSLAAVAFALPFHMLRVHARVLFGIVEVVVGFIVAGYRVDPSTSFWDLAAFLPFLTAGVYLVVQGIGNITEGLRSSDSDSLVALVRGLFATEPLAKRLPAKRLKTKMNRKSKLMILKERLKRRQNMR